MARQDAAGRIAATPIPGLVLDPALDVPLQRQLYAALRDQILDRRLAPGSQLPATRLLAEALELSRTTVALAYDQLRAEGYVHGRERSGTFVSTVIPDEVLRPRRSPARKVAPPPPSLLPSVRGAALSALEVSSTPGGRGSPAVAFRIGTPALDHFPYELWGRILAKRWRALTASQLAYGDPTGYLPLREAIAAYARQARAVVCDAAQVIVVGGAQQAFDLAARLLLDPGDVAAIEDPGYRGMRAALLAHGATLAPIPVDTEGIDVTRLRALAPAARLACVTPSHQFPLGVTMSAARRLALLEWARATGGWIVEDDFDSEYRFRARPLPSLQGMAPDGRVIYVGTFSKTLYPALRLGYLIVPTALVDAFARARATVDRHPAALEQAVLTDFIAEGHFARHVRRMRALYAERQELLLALLARELDDVLEAGRVDAGMHVVASLRARVGDDSALSAAAHAHGVAAVGLRSLALQAPVQHALLLGFAAFDEVEMQRGVERLRAATQELRAAGQGAS